MMKPHNQAKRRIRCWISWCLTVVGVIVVGGCHQFRATTPLAVSEPIIRAVSADEPAIDMRAKLLPPTLSLERDKRNTEKRDVGAGKLANLKLVPISLDAVLKLAEEHNLKVHLAREKLAEAFLEKRLADKSWIPDIWVGPSYYRHEGGIQDQTGEFIHSSFGAFFGGLELNGRVNFREATILRLKTEQQIHRQRGELSKLTTETLLEAAETYVDLLAVREAELFSHQIESRMGELRRYIAAFAKGLPIYEIEVRGLDSAILSQQQARRKMQHLGQSASAKLNYLLGLDSDVQLAPVDPHLAPFHLVDPSIAEEQLTARALEQGPGIREMNDLLMHLENGIREADGRRKWLPVVEFRVGEGLFGAGPGGDMVWDNRLDVGLRLRWNLSELCKAKTKRAIAQNKLQQARLGIGDLQAKLSFAVKEARMSTLYGAERIARATEMVESAEKTYGMSYYRLTKTPIKDRPSATPSLFVLRSWGEAQGELMEAIREHNKAQLRLMILVGGADACAAGGGPIVNR